MSKDNPINVLLKDKRQLAALLLVVYLFSGLLMEVTHTDGEQIRPVSALAAATSSHGASGHACQACVQASHQIFTLALTFTFDHIPCVQRALNSIDRQERFAAEHLFPEKRGPPKV